jgi:hypothetical protein
MPVRSSSRTAVAAPTTSVNVRIGALRLQGVAPAQAAHIGRALRQELASLLAAAGASACERLQSRARLDARMLRLDPAERPDVAGRRLAQAVAHAMLYARTDDDRGETR